MEDTVGRQNGKENKEETGEERREEAGEERKEKTGEERKEEAGEERKEEAGEERREEAGEESKKETKEGKTGNRRYCRKCLTRDMDQEEYFRSLREYIANLDADIKAPEAVYEERLSVCKECDLLLEGMCRSCGCYVELRAAVAKNNCPWKKW